MNKRVAIYRDEHDAIEPIHQSQVDGSITQDVDNDIQISVLLDRKDGPGSQYSPLYWVERIYQALAAKLFPSPQEAFDSILLQAKRKGLSENQEREILKWLGAMGFGIKGSDEALEKRSLQENGGYSVIDYKQKQVAAGLNSAVLGLTNVRLAKKNRLALAKLGSILARYKADSEGWKIKVRVAELHNQGFSPQEISKACINENFPADRIHLATMLLEQDVKKQNEDLKNHEVITWHLTKDSQHPLCGSEERSVMDVSHSKDDISPDKWCGKCKDLLGKKQIALKYSMFGRAVQLVKLKRTAAQIENHLCSTFPSLSKKIAKVLVSEAQAIVPFSESITKTAHKLTDDQMVRFCAKELDCSVPQASAILHTVSATIRNSLEADYKLQRSPVSANEAKKVAIDIGSIISHKNGVTTTYGHPDGEGNIKTATGSVSHKLVEAVKIEDQWTPIYWEPAMRSYVTTAKLIERESQTMPPKPNTDPGYGPDGKKKQWVWSPDLKAWAAISPSSS